MGSMGRYALHGTEGAVVQSGDVRGVEGDRCMQLKKSALLSSVPRSLALFPNRMKTVHLVLSLAGWVRTTVACWTVKPWFKLQMSI